MISKDVLRQIVVQQKSQPSIEKTVRREILDEILKRFGDNRIIILTGIRRSGKSTLLRQIMRERTGYCYVNFEDERFLDFRAQDFEQLNEILIEVYGSPKVYFFDEIQNVEKFEAFVRRLQDQGKKIVMTGSNATLLSKELGTRLTGRYRSFEVYPFSFSEYLAFRGVSPKKEWLYTAEKKVMLLKLFGDYLNDGGFPEYLKNKDREYIRTVYDNILYRDIISRYSIRRQRVVKELVNFLAANISSKFTYNSLKKALGLSNAITVKEYISYLSNSYMFFELQRFDFSIKRQLNLPKKIYVIDSALGQIVGFGISENRGRVLENTAFMELKRIGKDIYYYSNGNECDFLVKEGLKIKEAVQVCHALNETNREREVSGLMEAMEKFGLKEGLILTHEQEDEMTLKGKRIRVMPAWKWMLEDKV
jgi:predicted AAA+ superfamily ATPase